MKTLDATLARARYSDLLSRVQYRGERIVLKRNGKPAVAVVPVEDAALLENKADLFALQDALEDLEAELREAGKPVPRAIARALRALDDLEGLLSAAVVARDDAEAREKGEKPVPYAKARKELGLS